MRRALPTLALVLLLGGCFEPGEQFDAFLQRADRTPAEVEDDFTCGGFADLSDKDYLMNVLIRNLGDIPLLLRLTVTSFEPAGNSGQLRGELRFDTDPVDSEPLSSFEATLAADGTMNVDMGDVSVPAERSPVMSGDVGVPIVMRLAFDMLVLDADNLCGAVDGSKSGVTEPLVLGLDGTTFGAKSYGDDGAIPVDVPFDCPCGMDMQADAGTPEPDAGADAGAGP